jgi:hypothetical protein
VTQLEHAQKSRFGPFHLSFFLLSGLISPLGANDRAAAAAAAAGDCKNGGGGGEGVQLPNLPAEVLSCHSLILHKWKKIVFASETLQNVWQHLSNGRCCIIVKSILYIANSHNFRNYSIAIGEILVMLFIVCVYE